MSRAESRYPFRGIVEEFAVMRNSNSTRLGHPLVS